MDNLDKELSNIKYFSDLEQAVASGQINSDSLCLVGSSALALRQIRLNNDLDVITIDETDDLLDINNVEVTTDKYEHLGLSDKDIIEDNKYHDFINGHKIIRPELEYSYKLYRGKKKDLADIELLKEYQQSCSEWKQDLIIYESPTSLIDLVKQIRRFGVSSTTHLFRRYAQDTNPRLDLFIFGRRSLIARVSQSLKRDGVLTTFSRGFQIIKDNDPTGLLDKYSKPRYKIRAGNLIDGGIGLEGSLKDIIESQLQASDFQRYDLILCLLAIEQQISLDQLGVIKDDKLHSSLEVVKDYIQDWSPARISIGINLDGEILDPGLLTIGISESADRVSLELREENLINTYDMTWLCNSGLSGEVIRKSEARCEELLDELGFVYKFFVWPPARRFRKTIEDVISSYGSIIERQDLEMTPETFEDFVTEIYGVEHQFTDKTQHASKLQGKSNYSLEYGSSVLIYRVLLYDSKLKEGSSDTMAYAKEKIRTQCYTELPLGKAHLNPVIHGTDNPQHNTLVNDVIDTYS